jgi:hypothetical protein
VIPTTEEEAGVSIIAHSFWEKLKEKVNSRKVIAVKVDSLDSNLHVQEQHLRRIRSFEYNQEEASVA